MRPSPSATAPDVHRGAQPPLCFSNVFHVDVFVSKNAPPSELHTTPKEPSRDSACPLACAMSGVAAAAVQVFDGTSRMSTSPPEATAIVPPPNATANGEPFGRGASGSGSNVDAVGSRTTVAATSSP